MRSRSRHLGQAFWCLIAWNTWQARPATGSGDRASAAQLLLEADRAAPEEVRRNPHARALAASLAAGPVRSQALRELAARMNGNGGQPATGQAR